MPNWCQNQLTVNDATPEFRAWLEGGFSFQRMKPVTPADSPTQCSAWGTKWDLDDNEQREAASKLLEIGTAFFDTAWSPPLGALTALSAMFPDVTLVLDYHEPGNRFAGRALFEGGTCDDESTDDTTEVIRIAREVFGWDYDEDDEPTEAAA